MSRNEFSYPGQEYEYDHPRPAYEQRERCAKLVEEMLTERPWKDKPWARCALATAARAIRRGRHLTESEKLDNLMAAMAEEPQASD